MCTVGEARGVRCAKSARWLRGRFYISSSAGSGSGKMADPEIQCLGCGYIKLGTAAECSLGGMSFAYSPACTKFHCNSLTNKQ